jgi:GrpB-like predicted nucleotidyltransferase (UPF0157 family)
VIPRAVAVVDYDGEWPRMFEEEAGRIREACGGTILTIEHIGSTSVPGLAAKPIIDMMPGVANLTVARAVVIPAMERIGYESLGAYGIAGRLYFRRGEPRSYHVHMFEVGQGEWEKHLVFRDYLREHPEAVKEYAALKRELAEKHREDREAYTTAKSPFIQGILELAGWSTGRS